jgi:hypothetical protein
VVLFIGSSKRLTTHYFWAVLPTPPPKERDRNVTLQLFLLLLMLLFAATPAAAACSKPVLHTLTNSRLPGLQKNVASVVFGKRRTVHQSFQAEFSMAQPNHCGECEVPSLSTCGNCSCDCQLCFITAEFCECDSCGGNFCFCKCFECWRYFNHKRCQTKMCRYHIEP